VKLFSHSGGMFLFASLYFVFLLFIMPGILSVYLEDRRFATGEFFGAAGTFFWAFVRLLLWSLIPFVLVQLLHQAVRSVADYVGDRAVADQTGFYILVLGSVPVLLLFVWVRLWFDLAQVRVVALNETRTRRDVAYTFKVALSRTWRLYWSYVFIGVLIWVTTAVALLIWTRVRGRAVPLTFLLLEIIMLAHIVGRLWQKACATLWYRANPEPSAPAPITFEPAPEIYQQPPTLPVRDVDMPVTPEVESPPEATNVDRNMDRE
jgi:hypothetical protein